MASRYGVNFTNFQNISLYGSPTSAPTNVGMIEMAPGLTNAKSTISISMIAGSTVGSANGAVEHPYFHISNAGLSLGTGFIRLTAVGSSPYGTLAARSSTYFDTDTAWTFPAKSGIFPISGTFAIDWPVIAAAGYAQTVVTVSGIRVEDGVTVVPQKGSGFAVQSARGAITITEVLPGNGNLTIVAWNFPATATIPQTNTYAYTAVR